MNIIEHWRRLSVSSKISFGFATVLFLHVSIAIIGHYGLTKASADRAKQEELLERVEGFYEIDRAVSEMQRNVLLFAYGGFKGPEARAIELQKELSESLRAAQEFSSAENQNILEHMQEHLATHQEIFESVIADRAKRRELVDLHLTRCGNQFDQELDRIVASENYSESELAAVGNAFQSAQLHAMQFVHSPDSSFVRQTKRDLASTKQLLKEVLKKQTGGRQDSEILKQLVTEYEEKFIQMVQATRGYLHLTNVVLAGESQELFYLAKQAREHYSRRSEELSFIMARDSQRFSNASTLFSLLTIVLGMAASWVIQKSICPPLNCITETFDGLARGEKFEVIPGSERTDELGRLAAAAQVFRDKAAETEQLLDEVNYMRELERNHAHSQRMESLGQLAAGIAHEINTPLQCVASNVEFLEESYELLTNVIDDCLKLLQIESSDSTVDEEQLRKVIQSRHFVLMKNETPDAASEAANAVRRVVDIISAMKTLSHPGGNEKVCTDLNELVRNATTLSKHRWKDHAELEFQLEQDLPFVCIHQAEITQVLINLLVNAADAINSNEGQSGRITLRTKSVAGGSQIEVEDNGHGIPLELQARIFEPFFTTKDVGKGTGQGLSLAYDVMVRRHGGKITVDSTTNKTIFRLFLPTVSMAALV